MSSLPAYDDVESATGDELDAGIRAALERLGLSYEQLAEMAANDDFPSERARLLWFVIAPRDGAAC
jgi:hypothetical protein